VDQGRPGYIVPTMWYHKLPTSLASSFVKQLCVAGSFEWCRFLYHILYHPQWLKFMWLAHAFLSTGRST